MKTSNERFHTWTQHIYHHFAVDLGEIYLEERHQKSNPPSSKQEPSSQRIGRQRPRRPRQRAE